MARMVATKAALSIRLDALADADSKSSLDSATIGLESRAKLETRLRLLEQGMGHTSLRSIGKAHDSKAGAQKKFEMTGNGASYNDAADTLVPTGVKVEEVEDVEEKKVKKEKKDKKRKAEEEGDVSMVVDGEEDVRPFSFSRSSHVLIPRARRRRQRRRPRRLRRRRRSDLPLSPPREEPRSSCHRRRRRRRRRASGRPRVRTREPSRRLGVRRELLSICAAILPGHAWVERGRASCDATRVRDVGEQASGREAVRTSSLRSSLSFLLSPSPCASCKEHHSSEPAPTLYAWMRTYALRGM